MLTVMHFVSKMDRAGQETFIMNLFRKIDKSKYHFQFLCTEDEKGDYDDEIFELGGQIFYVDPLTIPGPLKQIQHFVNVRKEISAHPCDVFHIHSQHALVAFIDACAALSCKVKTVVVHSHNTSTLYHLGAHRFLKKLLALLPIKRFACSKAAGEWMFTCNNYRVINNGLNLDELYFREEIRESVRSNMGWDGKKIVAHVGRFNEQKNHEFLIDVFKRMHEHDALVHLVLIGKGELENRIQEKVHSLGLDGAVSFLGVRNDVQTLYQGMDLFLFPSLFEGLPVSLMEAQACDLPALISSSITEEAVVCKRTKQLSLEMDANIWAEIALQMLENAEKRTDNRPEIRLAGYDIAELANQLEDVYLNS